MVFYANRELHGSYSSTRVAHVYAQFVSDRIPNEITKKLHSGQLNKIRGVSCLH